MSDGYGNSGSGSGYGRGGQTPREPFIPKSPSEALRPEKVPEVQKRSKKARSQFVIFLNFVMSMMVILCIAGVAVFYYVISTYEEPGPLAVNTTFSVRNGAGLAEIARDLERKGIVEDARIFRYVTATHLRDGSTLKAGEYEIKAHDSMLEIMELLKSGKSILYSISFPEGLTVAQMFDRLRADETLTGDLPAILPPEGSLMPDTYKFSKGTSREEIVAQMRVAQTRLVDDVWSHRDPDLPIKTKEELVNLASIVEKETGRADERPHVASVFINRLEKGMRLQSDPTIIYGLFGGEGKPSDRPIYQSDLKKNTPYNTYIIKGLPPTPIANPGRAALEAVANPWKTTDLYFVADGTGGHVFAATLEEHNANVKRWRKVEENRLKEEAEQANGDATDTTGQ